MAPEPAIVFRGLEERDLPLVRGWADQPHWRQWWGEPDAALAEIAAAIGDDAAEPMLALIGREPAAYVQTYDPHLEDDHPYGDQPFGTLGVDLSIGPQALVGRGHGPAILAALAELLFAEGAPRLVVDPDPANARAIRACGKAGFRPLGERGTPSGRVLLMALDNPDPDEQPWQG